MDKTFSIAGVSRLNGVIKARFANDMTRVKVLERNFHTDIDLVELKHPMTKEDAVAYLLSIDFATKKAAEGEPGVTNEEIKAALEAELAKRQPKVVDPDAPKAKRGRPKKVKTEDAAPAPTGEEAPAEATGEAEATEEAGETESAPAEAEAQPA